MGQKKTNRRLDEMMFAVLMTRPAVYRVRVEIHSLTMNGNESAPDGWGSGWPFKIGDTVMIAADDGREQHESEILAFVPSTGRNSEGQRFRYRILRKKGG